MFAYYKYWKKLQGLEKKATDLEKEYTSAKESCRNQDDEEHLSFLESKQEGLDMYIEYYKTAYLKSQADYLLLPMLNDDPKMYITYNFDDECGVAKILTLEGMHNLRQRIREEKKAKREVIAFYSTVSTGVIGALIGLVTVLGK
jgi:hypothetical protein